MEESLLILISKCGDMREVTVKDLKDQSAATVEFLSRVRNQHYVMPY